MRSLRLPRLVAQRVQSSGVTGKVENLPTLVRGQTHSDAQQTRPFKFHLNFIHVHGFAPNPSAKAVSIRLRRCSPYKPATQATLAFGKFSKRFGGAADIAALDGQIMGTCEVSAL